MSKLLKSIFLISFLLFICISGVFATEEITITTYYPSPYGSYNSLQTDKLGVGDNNGDGVWTSADVPTASGDVWIKGKVGIGTTSSLFDALVVSGNIRTNGSIFINSGAPLYGSISANPVGMLIASFSNVPIYFAPDGLEKVRITTAGNVGIGTPAPAYKLDVIGTIRATGSVYYGGTAGAANGLAYIMPDYVFKDGYKLMAIEEVDEYLKKQGHLPWMASLEQDKKENQGAINLTRMGFATVETVENLQLQIITLNNLIKEQQKEINALKGKKG